MSAHLRSRLREGRSALGSAATRPVALLLAPVLVRQGARVRRQTPVLPEAAGDRQGHEGSGDSQAPLRLLVLGESSAAGVGVVQQRDGLARQLAVTLARRDGRAVAWQVSARTGATASAVTRELVPATSGPHDLVVVVVGVNDTLRLNSRRHWRERITRLLDALAPQLAPAGQILLAGVPDLGSFPALPHPLRAVLGWHSHTLDLVLDDVAARRADVLHAPAPQLTSTLFADDGFHPNAVAYGRWAQHIAELVTPPSTQTPTPAPAPGEA